MLLQMLQALDKSFIATCSHIARERSAQAIAPTLQYLTRAGDGVLKLAELKLEEQKASHALSLLQ